MGYLPDALPAPNTAEIDARDWWNHCKGHRLTVQCCASCGTFRHPPKPVCWKCHSFDFEWAEVSGIGTVYSYVVSCYPAHPALVGHTPYNVVLVELEDAGGARIVGNLLDCPNEDIRIGMKVQVVWEHKGEIVLPQWGRVC